MSSAPEQARTGEAALQDLIAALPPELAAPALSHSSWVNGPEDGYGRLAFLGDSVLGLTIAEELFTSLPQAEIGELTKIRNQAVSGRACAEVARRLELPDLLRERAPSSGDTGLPVETLIESERTLASVCEAVIGACLIAHGWEPTAKALLSAWADQIEFARSERLDFKSELQERLARTGASVTYSVVAEDGPAHDRRFVVRALAGGTELGVGSGRSKKESEQAAAAQALEHLGI